jgi:hypothetical protein
MYLVVAAALAAAVKFKSTVDKATRELDKRLAEIEAEKKQKGTPEVEETTVEYEGSYSHYHDLMIKVEGTLCPEELEEFESIESCLEEFLVHCVSQEEPEVQKLLIGVMSARCSMHGLDSTFPQDPRMLEAVFEVLQEELKYRISLAAKSVDQGVAAHLACTKFINLLRRNKATAAQEFYRTYA